MTAKLQKSRRNQEGYGLIGALVSLVFGFICGVIAFSFIFQLLGANPANAIVSWVYSVSAPLIAPFVGIFNFNIALPTGRLDIATLIALVVYAAIGGILMRVFSGGYRTHPV
jgi:uncharacterized protein YggT (Ycf19 family)